jgi:hypothetical protein
MMNLAGRVGAPALDMGADTPETEPPTQDDAPHSPWSRALIDSAEEANIAADAARRPSGRPSKKPPPPLTHNIADVLAEQEAEDEEEEERLIEEDRMDPMRPESPPPKYSGWWERRRRWQEQEDFLDKHGLPVPAAPAPSHDTLATWPVVEGMEEQDDVESSSGGGRRSRARRSRTRRSRARRSGARRSRARRSRALRRILRGGTEKKMQSNSVGISGDGKTAIVSIGPGKAAIWSSDNAAEMWKEVTTLASKTLSGGKKKRQRRTKRKRRNK